MRRAAGVQRLEQIQGFTAVAKVQKLVPARLETERQQIGECGVVLDDYYFRYIARFRLWGGGGRRGGGEERQRLRWRDRRGGLFRKQRGG